MSEDYFQNLGPGEKLWWVVANPHAAAFAYDRLLVCRLAAETQMDRIWEAFNKFHSDNPEPAPTAPPSEVIAFFTKAKKDMAPMLYETHYYFVAWANCGNMLRVLTGQPEFIEAKKVFDSHRMNFEHYTAARNSFEHYHDRLPGNTDEGKVRDVVQQLGAGPSRIYFGFKAGKYQHSDMSWDIRPTSLEFLKKAVNDVLVVLHQQVDELFRAKFGSR